MIAELVLETSFGGYTFAAANQWNSRGRIAYVQCGLSACPPGELRT
jgi:hypothetical protein